MAGVGGKPVLMRSVSFIINVDVERVVKKKKAKATYSSC